MSKYQAGQPPIIDSQMTREEAFAQDPRKPTVHADIIAMLTVVNVRYVDFRGSIHHGQIVVHKALAVEVRQFFIEAERIGFPIHSVIPVSDACIGWCNVRSCEINNSSGFNPEMFGEMDGLSPHARGMAIDINPRQNPYVECSAAGQPLCQIPLFGEYYPGTPGTFDSKHPLVKFMQEQGWTWGGTTLDYKHFEKVLDHP